MSDNGGLSAWVAELAIMRDRYRRNFCLPNFTPRRWWECDVFEVTRAGYFREYEVKMTISDFKADRKKGAGLDWHYKEGHWHRGPGESKHKRLEGGDAAGPCQFWFVTPLGLVATEPKPDLDPLDVLPSGRG